MVRETSLPRSNNLHHEFMTGSKSLSLDINLESYSASIRFGTSTGPFVKKIPGETTAAFLQADAFLYQTAQRVNHTITLTFDTANDNLKLWARAKYGELGFTSIEPNDPTSYRETITKIYTAG